MKLKVVEQLGSGGFGLVELVQDESTNEYARKTFVVNQPMSTELIENVRKRFIREARIQMGISHKNIVPVLKEFLKENPPKYLMPVAVGTLAKDLTKSRTLSGNFLSAFSDVVAGLEELHSMEIYHRDLKPTNVLKFKDGSESFYAISDFGLISQNDTQLSKLTTTGMAKGSDYYTAPEITADLKFASAQSDIYSLGCILHDMVGEQARVPCNEIREPNNPYGQVLLNCTRKDPKRRFKTVGAVLDALVSIEPVGATSATPAADDLIAALEAEGPMSQSTWSKVVEYLEDNADSTDAKAILRKLSLSRIAEICTDHPEQGGRLGNVFARWIQESAFDFDACDGLANRIEVFIERCSFDVKVDGLMAMLELGTSHNRWYVERKFFRLCGVDMDNDLAKRLAIEFRASDEDVCKQIVHLESSIHVTRSRLHPTLAKVLEEICE